MIKEVWLIAYLYLGKIFIDEGKIDIGLQNIAKSTSL